MVVVQGAGVDSFAEEGPSIGVATESYGITLVRLLCHQEDDSVRGLGYHGHSQFYIPAHICVHLFFGFLSVPFGFDCAIIRLLCVSLTKLVSRSVPTNDDDQIDDNSSDFECICDSLSMFWCGTTMLCCAMDYVWDW